MEGCRVRPGRPASELISVNGHWPQAPNNKPSSLFLCFHPVKTQQKYRYTQAGSDGQRKADSRGLNCCATNPMTMKDKEKAKENPMPGADLAFQSAVESGAWFLKYPYSDA